MWRVWTGPIQGQWALACHLEQDLWAVGAGSGLGSGQAYQGRQDHRDRQGRQDQEEKGDYPMGQGHRDHQDHQGHRGSLGQEETSQAAGGMACCRSPVLALEAHRDPKNLEEEVHRKSCWEDRDPEERDQEERFGSVPVGQDELGPLRCVVSSVFQKIVQG